MGSRAVIALAVASCTWCACGDNGDGDFDPLSAGSATVVDRTAAAFMHQVVGLDADTIESATAGNGQFNFVWQLPQLGPLFNNNACINCHTGNGRGLDEVGPNVLTGSQGLVRVSLATGTPLQPGGPVPVPGFGLQLRDHAELGAQQVNLLLSWSETPGTFGDGTAYSLRTPIMAITTPDGLPFRSDALQSFRQPPGAYGLGLLAAVPDDEILANADPTDANGDGIAGHPNMVWDVATSATVLGRFGVKANQSTIGQQVSGAFANDIGVTDPMFPDATGATEIGTTSINDVIAFLTTLAVPAPAPQTAQSLDGLRLFGSFGCASCHQPTLVTGDSPFAALANQTIHPYTDLLVHDVGPGLADNRPDFTAGGSEFRTSPLWGLGLVQVVSPQAGFLHDGRARTIAEAILWHDGEAKAAREAFRTADAGDRAALIAFLNTL